jgi:hypothetical protein
MKPLNENLRAVRVETEDGDLIPITDGAQANSWAKPWGRFHYEYRGEGANVECRVGAVIRGERDITWGEWLSAASVTTKNSPLWKTNPKQQLGYLQVKNWARAHTPGAILGVYSTDELEDFPVRDMGTAEVVETFQAPAASKTESMRNKIAAKRGKAGEEVTLDSVLKAIEAARNNADLTKAAEQAVTLGNDEDKAKARAAQPLNSTRLRPTRGRNGGRKPASCATSPLPSNGQGEGRGAGLPAERPSGGAAPQPDC